MNYDVNRNDYWFSREQLEEHDKQIRAEVVDEVIKIAIAEIDFESREEQHRFVGFMKQLKEEENEINRC